MVRDEADIIEATVGHMLTQVDEVIVADNGSTDGTANLLRNMGGVIVVDDPDPGFWQSRKMSRLARYAHDRDARWVIPVDADELWVSSKGTLKELLEEADPDYGIVTAELYDHVATAVDPDLGDAIDQLPWRRRHCLPLPKVAVRAHPDMVIEQGNHWARLPIPPRATLTPQITVHHYARRTVEQFIHKVRVGFAAYQATEGLPENVGAHWRQWGHFNDDQLRELFFVWYHREDPLLPYTVPGTDPPEVHDPLIWDNPQRGRCPAF